MTVAMGWRRRGANLETTLGVVGGSALLNVVGLVTIWALFPPGMAWGRIVASLAMVLLVTPAIARVSTATAPEDHAPVGLRLEVSATEQEHSWRAASSAAVRRWWWSSVGIAHRMFVPMVLATFLAAFARLLISPEATSEHLGGGFVAIAATALVGTLIAIPTLFEIPLVVGLMALGMGAGPATALLITAPSMSLITWFMLRRETGARPPTLLLIATFALGLIAGLLVEGWSANVG